MDTLIIHQNEIKARIYSIRDQGVLIDRDLANLYGVETRVLKQAVRRNMERFPEDFMFIMTKEEFANWRSQFVMSKEDSIGLRHPPMAFTEQGVAMLSSVLNSKRAILVNIQIMRAFVRIRQSLKANEDLLSRINSLEEEYDEKFKLIFKILKKLMPEEPSAERKRIGFKS